MFVCVALRFGVVVCRFFASVRRSGRVSGERQRQPRRQARARLRRLCWLCNVCGALWCLKPFYSVLFIRGGRFRRPALRCVTKPDTGQAKHPKRATAQRQQLHRPRFNLVKCVRACAGKSHKKTTNPTESRWSLLLRRKMNK